MEELTVKRSDHLVEVSFERPSRANALSESMVDGLLKLIDECARNPPRLFVLSGKGKHFCAGFDLGDLDDLSDGDLLWRLVRIETLLQRLHHASFPTMALAHGTVVGAGSDLVCACSRRVASPGTTFRMPGWRFGVALGTRRLNSRVGVDAARSVLMESRVFNADEALQIGFLDCILSTESWSPEIRNALHAASYLEARTRADLLRTSARDTGVEDMASLVETAARPGLKERISDYRRNQKLDRRAGRPPVAPLGEP